MDQRPEEIGWASLDIYVLLKIFCRIPLNDLSWNVSFVCVSWQKACYELMFWNQNKLDLRIASRTCSKCNSFGAKTSNLFELGLSPIAGIPEEDEMMDAKMTGLLKGVMVGGGDDFGHEIYAIYVPCDLLLSDRHLVYIAERAPNAVVLVIEKAAKITPKGISEALRHWKELLEIDLKLIQYDLYEEMLEVISNGRGGELYGVRLMATATNSDGGRQTKYYDQ